MNICPKRTRISKREHLDQLWKGIKLLIKKQSENKKFKLGETDTELTDECGNLKEAELNV